MKTTTPAEKFSKRLVRSLCNFVKMHKLLIICMAAAFLLCLATIIAVSVIRDAQAHELLKTQIGKCYKEKTYGSWSGRCTNIYYFTENGMVDLSVHYGYRTDGMVESVLGSLDDKTQYNPFNVSFFGETYIFGNRLVKLNENNEIVECQGNAWELISLEEALEFEKESRELWAQGRCEHEYGKMELTAQATCSQNGKKTKTCNKCGYVWVEEIDKLPHKYVNNICSVCGTEWVPEKSNLKPNTWYTINDGVLHVQNCLVESAVSTNHGKAMSVMYYAVCQHCHVIDNTLKLAGPEVNYEVKKIHYCSECEGETLVRLIID